MNQQKKAQIMQFVKKYLFRTLVIWALFLGVFSGLLFVHGCSTISGAFAGAAKGAPRDVRVAQEILRDISEIGDPHYE